MNEWLQSQWYRLSIGHIFLLPFSFLFLLLSALRRVAYGLGLFKTISLPVPVIVVGNISVGGTGKTPLILWLAEFLAEQGYRPGIISRGYASRAKQPQSVSPATDPALVGDEAVLLAQRLKCPVWVGEDRVAVARALLVARPDCNVILSDDGLQHYRLGRDVEVAVVDGMRRFGNGFVLPAGPLREPQQRLQCVDAVVVNGGKAAENEYAMSLQGRMFRNVRDGEISADAADFSDQNCHAVAGIGHPSRFFSYLRSLGLSVVEHAFSDHHAFTPQDLQFNDSAAILMTEKDAVKCRAFAPAESWFLRVDARLDNVFGEIILERLRKLENGRKTA
ncbi:MAG: tetraacyldisaccharide 4'-kinase [Methylophilales bacterium]|nr:tetraacyldisaccharide 4'-kinase [Methylophilales bacterium]